MWLGSGEAVAVAVTVASSNSSDSTPHLGTSYAMGAALKSKNQTNLLMYFLGAGLAGGAGGNREFPS